VTVIAWSSFRVLSPGLLKDHAVTVSYALTTRTPPRPSYTAPMDSTGGRAHSWAFATRTWSSANL